MEKVYYLVRLDDACPWQNKKKWNMVEQILEKYAIRPMVGIIPHNEDKGTIIDETDENFASLAQSWERKGWAIALHGYNHVCSSNDGGINPIHQRSEYAGVSLEKQCEKMRKGYELLRKLGVTPQYFFAPSHTFDENTMKALINETGIRIVSDTIALRPYKKGELAMIPQQMGRFRKVNICGYWTFCFHPNIMKNEDFIVFESFIRDNADRFIAFQDIPLDDLKEKSIVDKLLQWVYFIIRKIR